MRAVLSLGSNLGDRVYNLVAAVEKLEEICTVECVSSLYESSPVSDVIQDDFLNIACLVAFDSTPAEFLHMLHKIEAALGRTREVHWGPRTIDIDIVDIDGFASEDDTLHVPHRHATQRKFVLLPSAEIAPEWELQGNPMTSWRDSLSTDDVVTPYVESRWVHGSNKVAK